MLLFLAPETRGDFHTLMDAVRGRPGAFVRTSQDLNQATLDRSRLQSYLTAIRSLDDADPAKLKRGRAAAGPQSGHQGGREMPGSTARSCRRPVS